LKLKTAILLCLIAFASMATVTVGLSVQKPNLNGLFEKTVLDSDPLPPGPLSGDPVGGGGGPH